MESEIWSVEVKGNKSFKFTVGDEFVHITEVALFTSVDISEKCLGLEHFHDTVLGMPKASLKDITPSRATTQGTTTSSSCSIPTSEECMEIVEGFQEAGTWGYQQALLLFYSNESARVHFMIPPTKDGVSSSPYKPTS